MKYPRTFGNPEFPSILLFCLTLTGCWWPSPDREPLQRGEEVVWAAEFEGWACGDLTSQIMPIEGIDESLDFTGLHLGLIFYVTQGMASPDRFEGVGVPGNQFLLRGHFYYRQEEERKVVAPRFDLIGWVPVRPFHR